MTTLIATWALAAATGFGPSSVVLAPALALAAPQEAEATSIEEAPAPAEQPSEGDAGEQGAKAETDAEKKPAEENAEGKKNEEAKADGEPAADAPVEAPAEGAPVEGAPIAPAEGGAGEAGPEAEVLGDAPEAGAVPEQPVAEEAAASEEAVATEEAAASEEAATEEPAVVEETVLEPESIEAAPADVPTEPTVPVVEVKDEAEDDVPWWKEPWSVSGGLSYRTHAVTDVDPANDMSLTGTARLTWNAFEGGKVFLGLGFNQRFVAQGNTCIDGSSLCEQMIGEANANAGPGESGTQFQDMRLGITYGHEVGLDSLIDNEWLEEHPLKLSHGFTFLLPTSDPSSDKDMILAARASSKVGISPIEGLNTGVNASLQYNFFEFAEAPGYGAGTLPQLITTIGMGGSYTQEDLFVLPGSASLSFGVFTAYVKNYASGQPGTPAAESELVDGFVGDSNPTDGGAGVDAMWRQLYGWSLMLSYTPIEYVTAAVGFEQNSPVLRAGAANVFGLGTAFRDEIDFVMSLSGNY